MLGSVSCYWWVLYLFSTYEMATERISVTTRQTAATVNQISKLMNVSDICRQGFWASYRPKPREDLAHLVGLIMQRICGEASAAFRWSFVDPFSLFQNGLPRPK